MRSGDVIAGGVLIDAYADPRVLPVCKAARRVVIGGDARKEWRERVTRPPETLERWRAWQGLAASLCVRPTRRGREIGRNSS